MSASQSKDKDGGVAALPHHTRFYEINARVWLWAAAAAVCAFSTAFGEEPRTPHAPPQVVLCRDCGMISAIRRIERPIAPDRKLLPDVASMPREGESGHATQAVPLFVIGGGNGARRVAAEPIYRSTWEVTIRYDNGSFGFVTVDAEPELAVGDRVRLVENVLELLTNTRH